MASLNLYQCPKCGRSFSEMRGPLMGDLGPEPAEKREQRRLMLRPLRDRLHGIKRRPPQASDISDTPGASDTSDTSDAPDTSDISDAPGASDTPDPELRFVDLDSELIICRRCDLVMPVVMRARVD